MTATAAQHAHLRQSFDLMAEITGSPAAVVKTTFYANLFTDQHIALADVNAAIGVMMVGWQKPYWPSPESVAAKAREIAAHRAFRESPRGLQSVEVEQNSLRERDAAWEDRRGEAEVWCSTRPEETLAIAHEVERDIQTRLSRSPNGPFAKIAGYREAWREGAMVGAVLKKIGEVERKLERQREREKLIAENRGLTGQ